MFSRPTPQVARWRLREAQRPSESWPVQPQILCKWRGFEDRVGSPAGCPGGGGRNSMGLGNAAGCPEGVALHGTWITEGIHQGLHKASGGEAGAARARRIRVQAQLGPEDGGGRLGGAAGSQAPGGGPVPCSAGGRGPPTVLGATSVADSPERTGGARAGPGDQEEDQDQCREGLGFLGAGATSAKWRPRCPHPAGLL